MPNSTQDSRDYKVHIRSGDSSIVREFYVCSCSMEQTIEEVKGLKGTNWMVFRGENGELIAFFTLDSIVGMEVV